MTTPRCYSRPEVLALLRISAPTFHRQRKAGRLWFIQEIPSPFRRKLYRADLIDRYLSGERRIDARKPTATRTTGRHVPATT